LGNPREHRSGGTHPADFFGWAVPAIRARFSLLSIKGTCGMKKVSKIFRTDLNEAPNPDLLDAAG
jgi:hypothetical protein